jgi:hypothetical protein
VLIHGWVLLLSNGFRGLIARPACRRRRASALAVLIMFCGFCGVAAKQAVRIGQLERIVSTNGTHPSASEGARSSEAGIIRSLPPVSAPLAEAPPFRPACAGRMIIDAEALRVRALPARAVQNHLHYSSRT